MVRWYSCGWCDHRWRIHDRYCLHQPPKSGVPSCKTRQLDGQTDPHQKPRGVHGLKAMMLSDRDLIVIDAFGLRYQLMHSGPTSAGEAEALLVPTTMLLDANGKVLIPQPRYNLVRYHGVLRGAAPPPNSKLKGCIAPKHRKKPKKKGMLGQKDNDLMSKMWWNSAGLCWQHLYTPNRQTVGQKFLNLFCVLAMLSSSQFS
ncbi:MAG: hypothetical protein ACI9VI_000990 [Candidatus Azotimanducaceae bacterium]|jgi:hypothetical protein